MSYNITNNDGIVRISNKCIQDSNIGFEANFSNNGNVDGWTYYSGIHTYGCWNGYLFGTLYGSQAVIGRGSVFLGVDAEYFYTVRLTMRISLVDRAVGQNKPTKGRIMWQTLTNSVWNSDKQYDFDLVDNEEWYTYNINMGEAQWWQGDINNLRVYPILSDGRPGDQFFIKNIEILSSNTYKCLNTSCSYYSNFEHNCPGIGTRGYCASGELAFLVSQGSTFNFAADVKYSIIKDFNDTLLVNINGYGYENVKIPEHTNINGNKLAKEIEKELSKVDIGGYAECEVYYTDRGSFIIYSGVYNNDSTVYVGDTVLSRQLNFYDSNGVNISSFYTGTQPASGFSPLSSFRIRSQQINNLMDSDNNTELYFNPYVYSIEGGRQDWLEFGLGNTLKDVQGTLNSATGMFHRTYSVLDNTGSTIIDFNHPFNASGRITKVYAAVTLDAIGSGRGTQDATRKSTQLTDAKILFFRPMKDGSLKTLPIELSITNRNHDSGKIYSENQEYVEINCDIFINKGDYIGIYNANIYKGISVTGEEIDATYRQISYKPVSGQIIPPAPLSGQGSGGLLVYARSSTLQKRLVLEADLGKRLNIENIRVVGNLLNDKLEYNIASCLDISWQVDLFSGHNTTGYIYSYRPRINRYYNHPSIAYGVSCLSDGIKTVPDGLAASTYSVNYATYYTDYYEAYGKKNGGSGVILNSPKYFSVNGDNEWLGVYALTGTASFSCQDFESDPIAFTVTFPYEIEKKIHKSIIYFKERYNFRSFALSFYKGQYYNIGNADDKKYELIPNRGGYNTPWKSIKLNGLEYTPDNSLWASIDKYLAENPCSGKLETITTSINPGSYDDYLGENNYEATQLITNMEQYIQAVATDWTKLEHEWEPTLAKGFRFYCDYHLSTKICEFELYGAIDNDASSLTGSVDVLYSSYADYWWFGQNLSSDTGTDVFIGDTPQYLEISIRPVSEMYLKDISIDVSPADVYMGDKGCQTLFIAEDSKINSSNSSQVINFKNVYGNPYDLYVDIAQDRNKDTGVVFHSLLNNEDSIINPLVGPDAYYVKSQDYPLINYNSNVAINCPVHRLKNLAHGAKIWYSHDDDYSWTYYGEVDESQEIGFSNLPSSTITTLELPTPIRSKWWKIGFLDNRITTNVREIRVYYQNTEIEGINFYHHKNQDAYVGANTDTAPHMQNGIIDGSYYILTGNYYIGIELPELGMFDKLIIYHDALSEIEDSHDKAGIDYTTALCLISNGIQGQTDAFLDYSYYEHSLEVVGSGIYSDISIEDISYSFNEDFIGCDLPSDWYEDTSSYLTYYSTFTCTSGVCPTVSGGYARSFAIQNHQYINAGTWKKPQIFPSQNRPLDETYEFNLKFVMKIDSFTPTNNNWWADSGPSIGVAGFRPVYYSSAAGGNVYYSYTTGAQVLIHHHDISLFVFDQYTNKSQTSEITFNHLGIIHYYEFTSDGKGNYHLNVWSDGFNGSSKVIDLSISSGIRWEADRVGIGACDKGWGQDYNPPILSSGWIGDIQFTCSKASKSKKLGVSSIRFNGYSDSYLKLDYDISPKCNLLNQGLELSNKRFTIDFWIKFKTLPVVGDVAWIVGSWHPNQPLTGAIIYPSSWLLYIERASTTVLNFVFKINNNNTVYTSFSCPYVCKAIAKTPEALDVNRWYHIYIGRGYDTGSLLYGFYLIDGYTKLGGIGWSEMQTAITSSSADIIVGKKLDGVIDQLRISSDSTNNRLTNFANYATNVTTDSTIYKSVPTNPYNRYYTFSIFDSPDNYFYGKTMDVDTMFDNNFSYHQTFSSWSKKYYSYLAFDLGQRHVLDIIRSFPVDTAFQFTKTSSTLYSNKDTTNPKEAFTLTEAESEVGTDFTGQDFDFPFNWIKNDTSNSNSYIIDNTFYQEATPTTSQATAFAESKFYLKNDFDISIDFDLSFSATTNSNMWEIQLGVVDINNSNNSVLFERTYRDGTNKYEGWVKNNSGTAVKFALINQNDLKKTMRIERRGQAFKIYLKDISQSFEEFVLKGYYQTSVFGVESKVFIKTISSTNYPTIRVWWDNFTLLYGDPIFSTYQDARWLKVKLYNGDGTTRTVRRIGVYPDITYKHSVDGKHNCSWESLGSAITSYSAGENIALGAEVTASSYIGYMFPDRIVDGRVPQGDINMCWGSTGESYPWILITLPSRQQIYRIKIYHGISDTDTSNMINNYQIQISDDAEAFTTIFSITGNTSSSRVHDLTYPVWATYVRIYITSYSAASRFVWTGDGSGNQFWKGAVLREVEVYKYYGYTVIDSESAPIIAIDLNQNYYINSHSIVGIDSESTTTDWDNSSSNFAYSNSNLDDPEKVAFTSWGTSSSYDKWVAVKRNTATKYPTTNDAKDYLKHVVVSASYDNIGTKPNPLEYPWMWYSNFSTLSYDYTSPSPNYPIHRNLKIEYPSSSGVEHVYFIEGDHFGIDDEVSWRDGFGLGLYIDNIDNFDLSYGYIYLGGFDYTQEGNPIIHKWYFSTISGVLASGWNDLHLSFKYSDELSYTELRDKEYGRDPRRLHTIRWGKTGMVFRGKGQALQLNLSGIYIRRNHFEHTCFKDYGLYLHNQDFLKTNVGDIDMCSTSIEFWIRPNWDWEGVDIYNDFNNRTLFHMGNTANDVIGATVSSSGIDIYYGNILNGLKILSTPLSSIGMIDEIFHLAFVFSNNGSSISSDGSTIRLYINNILITKSFNTWTISDEKNFTFILGGQSILAQKVKEVDSNSSAVDGVVGRLKIYNYCKTDYTDSVNDSVFTSGDSFIKPSEFIEISRDNLTFIKVGSEDLPFIFRQVPHGDTIPIWVRTTIPNNLTGNELRTSEIIGSWDIGV